jgi:hypothetical protein
LLVKSYVRSGHASCQQVTVKREALKKRRDVSDVEHLRLVMWSHFARSLDAMNFDLSKHPSWHQYAKAYLANEHTRETHGVDAVRVVAAEFGGAAADRKLRNGSSYWGGEVGL